MDDQRRLDDECYAVQHFGCSARTLANSVYNVCSDYTEACLDSIKTAVLETLKDKAPADLDHRMDSLFTELTTSLGKDCDRLQLFAERDVMRVPSYVLLPEDEVHRSPDSDEIPVAKLKEQVTALKKRITQEKMRQQALKDELALQDVARRHLRSTLEKICEVQEGLPRAADASSIALPEGSNTIGGGELLPSATQSLEGSGATD